MASSLILFLSFSLYNIVYASASSKHKIHVTVDSAGPAEKDVQRECYTSNFAELLKTVVRAYPHKKKHVKKTKKYVLKHIEVNWFRANLLCAAEGKRLATIMSNEESNELKATLNKLVSVPPHMWISATDLAEEGTFMWMPTGEPMHYTNWFKHNAREGGWSEPNNKAGNEHCVTVLKSWEADYSWNDDDCATLFPCICEYFT